MSLKTNLGSRIRNLRLDKGYSQEVLAERAAIDRTYMSAIERGERNVSIEIVEKLAIALSITISELFNFHRLP